jgi:hypothetical protein
MGLKLVRVLSVQSVYFCKCGIGRETSSLQVCHELPFFFTILENQRFSLRRTLSRSVGLTDARCVARVNITKSSARRAHPAYSFSGSWTPVYFRKAGQVTGLDHQLSMSFNHHLILPTARYVRNQQSSCRFTPAYPQVEKCQCNQQSGNPAERHMDYSLRISKYLCEAKTRFLEKESV